MEAVRELLQSVLIMFRAAKEDKGLNIGEVADQIGVRRQTLRDSMTSLAFRVRPEDSSFEETMEVGIQDLMSGKRSLFPLRTLLTAVTIIFFDESDERVGFLQKSFRIQYKLAVKELEDIRASQTRNTGVDFDPTNTTEEIQAISFNDQFPRPLYPFIATPHDEFHA